jgi:ATP-dependent Clp protease protease subunit
MVNKIGTVEDFIHFGNDKLNINKQELEQKVSNMVYPTIIEERDQAMRISEMNVFSRLIQDRILFLSGGVDTLSMDTMVAQLLYLDSVDNRDISLYINSPGGDVIAGLSLIDTMNFIKSDVSTMCLGMAASMGAVLLSSGAKGKRFVLPHSRVMIHQVSSGMHGVLKDMEIDLQQTIKCKQDIYNILAENTGKSFEEIEKDCDRNFWLIGSESVTYGLADKVLERN